MSISNSARKRYGQVLAMHFLKGGILSTRVKKSKVSNLCIPDSKRAIVWRGCVTIHTVYMTQNAVLSATGLQRYGK